MLFLIPLSPLSAFCDVSIRSLSRSLADGAVFFFVLFFFFSFVCMFVLFLRSFWMENKRNCYIHISQVVSSRYRQSVCLHCFKVLGFALSSVARFPVLGVEKQKQEFRCSWTAMHRTASATFGLSFPSCNTQLTASPVCYSWKVPRWLAP